VEEVEVEEEVVVELVVVVVGVLRRT